MNNTTTLIAISANNHRIGDVINLNGPHGCRVSVDCEDERGASVRKWMLATANGGSEVSVIVPGQLLVSTRKFDTDSTWWTRDWRALDTITDEEASRDKTNRFGFSEVWRVLEDGVHAECVAVRPEARQWDPRTGFTA